MPTPSPGPLPRRGATPTDLVGIALRGADDGWEGPAAQQ